MALKVGVIGLGLIGDIEVDCFTSYVEETEVVAVCDTDSERMDECAAKYSVPRKYAEGMDLIEKEDLDILVIGTPPESHHRYSLAGIARGWHVLCEKPTAMNATEAEEMLQAAQEAGIVNIIDHELRYNGNRQRVKELIDAGYIGKPRHALVNQIGNGLVKNPWTWWSTMAMGGGGLGEFGSHAIDLLRWWLGDVEKAYGEVHTFITSRPDAEGKDRVVDSDDYMAFSLHFASGARAQLTMSGVAGYPAPRKTEIHGEEGALVLDAEERLWGYQSSRDEPEELTVAETIPSLVGMDMDYYSPSLVRLAKDMVGAILNDRSPTFAADFNDGLHIQRVLDQVRASSAAL